ncbi:MAG: DUF6174 domain-containing protein, partial [Planctomycetota bacterium]
ALSLAFVLGSCDDSNPPAGGSEGRLEVQLEKWNGDGPLDYQFRFERICFCLASDTRPVILEVRDGEIISATDAESGDELNPESDAFLTVDDLFIEVREAMDRSADSLDVRYDSEFGFPASVDIDFDRRIADEEVSYRASDLVDLSDES